MSIASIEAPAHVVFALGADEQLSPASGTAFCSVPLELSPGPTPASLRCAVQNQADESTGHYWRFVQGLQVLERKRAAPSKCWRLAVEKAAPLVLPSLAKVRAGSA